MIKWLKVYLRSLKVSEENCFVCLQVIRTRYRRIRIRVIRTRYRRIRIRVSKILEPDPNYFKSDPRLYMVYDKYGENCPFKQSRLFATVHVSRCGGLVVSVSASRSPIPGSNFGLGPPYSVV